MDNSQILDRMETIEYEQLVVVLYACESGSRVWGFASEDSDYDVRFLYVHPEDWYLSVDVERKFDTIEIKNGPLDMVGWDLRKALHLMYKSNPPLWEWLQSPIVYSDWAEDFLRYKLDGLMERYYSPAACFYHYFHMAENNWKKYLLDKPIILLKKYLYVLRPLLACRWILDAATEPVPVEFEDLCNILLLKDTSERRIVQNLVDDKRAGRELGESLPIPELHQFLEDEFAHLSKEMEYNLFPKQAKPPKDSLNKFFRLALHVAWD